MSERWRGVFSADRPRCCFGLARGVFEVDDWSKMTDESGATGRMAHKNVFCRDRVTELRLTRTGSSEFGGVGRGRHAVSFYVLKQSPNRIEGRYSSVHPNDEGIFSLTRVGFGVRVCLVSTAGGTVK